MSEPTVEEGLRAWLRVLPPTAPLRTPLLVADLASHLRSDALETVRIMEREAVAELVVRERCPVCLGLDGVHVDTDDEHDYVALEHLPTFSVRPENLPRWLVRRLIPFDIVIELVGSPVVLERAVECDARIDAPPRVDGATQRPARLRLGMGGSEAPLVLHPGREYLRLRLGSAVDLSADRRVIDIDVMALFGSERERRELWERLRRRLQGLRATALVPPGASLDALEQSQCVAALEHALVNDGRYRAETSQAAWRALAEDWGIPGERVLLCLERIDGVLLVCECDTDAAPHIHAFASDGASVDATRFEPAISAFAEHAHRYVRQLQEFAALRRHLSRGAGLARGLVAFVGTATVTEAIGYIWPGTESAPVHLIAVGLGAGLVLLLLHRPLRRFGLLTWRLRTGSWEMPAREE